MRPGYTYWRLAQSEIFRETALIPSRSKLSSGSADLNPVREQMEVFLRAIERKAFVMAHVSLQHADDAHDVVQDSMIRLVRNYTQRPREEWEPLFYRILKNRIVDLQRRRTVRRRFMAWLPIASDELDPIAEAPGHLSDRPDHTAQLDETMEHLERAVGALPARQRQAFLLRTLGGLDVKQTAVAMECSAGSVKTHYSRAIHSLRSSLGTAWGEGHDE